MVVFLKKDFFIKLFTISAAAILAAVLFNTFNGIPLIERREKREVLNIVAGLPEEEGIHLVGFEAALRFYESGKGPLLDARPALEYEKGHIPGAQSCPVYDLDSYLPQVLKKIPLDSPILVYCNGADCEDSRFLAESLREAGYRRLYVYLGGYSEWLMEGMKVEKGGENQLSSKRFDIKRLLDLSVILPGWFWLSADLIFLGLGILVVLLVTGKRRHSLLVDWAARIVGLVFVAASLYKIASPAEFARIVDNYRILPGIMVNLAAVVMPWLELFAGALLLLGRSRASSSAILLFLIMCFILAVGFNMARGLEFDCGCFGGGHVPPWRILLRDTGLFLCCLTALLPDSKSS